MTSQRWKSVESILLVGKTNLKIDLNRFPGIEIQRADFGWNWLLKIEKSILFEFFAIRLEIDPENRHLKNHFLLKMLSAKF